MNIIPTTVRPAVLDDLPSIVNIYNHAVRETTAIWNSSEVDLQNRTAWFHERRQSGYPIFVAVEAETVLGYAAYGPFRPFEGYSLTVENSVYVSPSAQGKGVGKQLVAELLNYAKKAGIHVMVAGIEASNAASIHLHEVFGFEESARMREVGRKFGRYLDLVLMQKIL